VKNKIKKLKINKIIRIALIIVTILVLCVLSFLLYREIKIPKVNEKTVKLYSYTNKSSTDYEVLLKPNSLYNTTSLGEGMYYITNYVDNIEATFNYEYSGDRNADIKGYYEVAAVVKAYTIQEKENITIWERKFVLSPRTEFASKDKMLTLAKSVNIKLSEYNDFVTAIVEESKVQTPVQLNVYMNVSLNADTDKGPVEAKIAPAISIPLDEAYFLIAESETKEEPGSIEETKKVQLPPNKQKIILYECGLGVLILVVFGLIIFTESVTKSPFIKKLNKIFKQHGSRLVALNNELLAATLENCNIVRNIDDLVRVADELGRPIMYEYSEEYNDIVHFYILDDKRTYIYILRDIMNGVNVSLDNEKKVVL